MSRWSGDKKHDRPSASEEGYAARCEGSERDGMRFLRPLCFTV